MSASRVVLVLVQAFANQLACTPPNPTPSKGRYHTNELYILRIAPFIFKCHQIVFWTCATFEVLFFLQPYLPFPPLLQPNFTSTFICPSNKTTTPSIQITPMFLIGITAAVLGSYIRLDCFKALGHMFTFDLTIHPEHKLITHHFYAYVRHPAYTGSLLLVGGLTLSHLTKGSWLTECGGPLTSTTTALVVWVLWWSWTICVGVSRARAEDEQMRMLFKEEWEAYAVNVPWWFFPGVV